MANSEAERRALQGGSAQAVTPAALDVLQAGCVIPAHPLALDENCRLDERRQRALSRYYLAAGAGGLAVGVHTTQFEIHEPQRGLLKPVWTLAAEEMNRHAAHTGAAIVRVAGICGNTRQAVEEAALARDLGYEFGLINLGSSGYTGVPDLLAHTRAIAETIDVFGFYLQPAVGGIDLPHAYWQGFCEIPAARAIKVAAFDRYKSLTVVRAVAESGRHDIALYTGNDDNILVDLVTPFRFRTSRQASEPATVERRFVGGLLGQWAIGTRRAVETLAQCRALSLTREPVPQALLQLAAEWTDLNAAVFDAEHAFRGCLPGIHEVLRRQRLLAGTWCIDERLQLSSGQCDDLDRVLAAYPHLCDDEFIATHRDAWLRG